MSRVVAIILHAVPEPNAGPLERAFAEDRRRNADRQARGFAALGATVEVIEMRRDDPTFGERLRGLARDHGLARTNDGAGLVVMGSGSIPLARQPDRAIFVAAAGGSVGAAKGSVAAAGGSVAASGGSVAAAGGSVGAAGGSVAAAARVVAGRSATGNPLALLANNRFSADILAIPAGIDLAGLPDLAADNAVPRWAVDQGIEVRDLRDRWRLQVDLDSPLDVVLVGSKADRPATSDDQKTGDRVDSVLERARAVAADPAREFLVAGRTSSTTLRWVERNTASRTRVLIEERGMKTALPGQRPTRSALGLLLDRNGPGALGTVIEQLADAAAVDSRVLMAHHFGRAESAWPEAEDRFASDLLLPDHIRDPWLRALTASAARARVPILLGGHTLVGPGLRLALGPRRLHP